MQLISCYVENFGRLAQFEYQFHEGVNTIVEENGWGKTTFAAFIKAMFYGIPSTTKRSVLENERKKYLPWQGGSYGGSLAFKKDGTTYRIERFFGDKDKDDTFTLYHQDTGLLSNDYSEKIGEELFGIDLQGYERSTYIAQNHTFIAANDSINTKLSHLVEDGNDINHYEKAVADLEEAMKYYKKTGNRGRIAELETQLSAVTRSLERTVGCEEALQTWEGELRLRKGDLKAISAERQTVKERIVAASTEEAQKAKRAHYETLCAERRRVMEERQALIDFFCGKEPTEEELQESVAKHNALLDIGAQIGTESDKMNFFEKEFKDARNAPAGGSRMLCVILGVLAMLFWAVAAFVFLRMSSVFGAVGAGTIGFILLIVFLALRVRSRKVGAEKEQKVQTLAEKYHGAKRHFEELRQLKEQYENEIVSMARFYFSDMSSAEARGCLEELKLKKKELRDADRELHRLSAGIEEFEKYNPEVLHMTNENEQAATLSAQSQSADKASALVRLQAEEQGIEAKTEALRSEISNMEAKIEELQAVLDARNEYEGDKARISEELLQAQERFELLEDTLKYLKKAKELFSTHYLQDIKNGFEKYLNMLCDSISGQASMDIKFGVKIEDKGVKRELDYYSEGYKDLIGICARFALVDALFEGETPFIILDDPFANLDEEKLSKALQLVEQIGKEYQVIYFVCHRSRA